MLFCSAVWQLRRELPSVIAKRVNKLWTDALSCEMDTNHQSLIYDQCWRPLLLGQPQQQQQQLENFLASSLHYVIYIFVCFVVLFLPIFLSDNVALNTRWLIGNFSTGDWFTTDHLISCHRQANFLAASNFALLLYCSFCSCVQTEPLIGRSIDLFAINFLSLSNSPALIVCLSDCFLCWQWSNGALFLNWSLS